MAGKLGLGIYLGDGRLIPYAVNSEATCLLLHDGALNLAAEIKRQAPNLYLIGRKWDGWSSEDDYIRNGPDWCEQRAMQLCQEYPAIDAWTAFCEYIPGAKPDDWNEITAQVAKVKAQYECDYAWARGCGRFGKKGVAHNGGTGGLPMREHTTQVPLWAPHVRMLASSPHVLFGIHSYGTPKEAVPGANGRMHGGQENYYALRYREFVLAMRGEGITLPPIVFTEFGQTDGWRGWFEEGDAGDDLCWFGDRINEDPEVFGSAYFLCGDHDPDKWHSFDIEGTGIVGKMASWNRAHPTGATPPPPPNGGGTPVKLSEQYPNEYAAWVAAGGVESNFADHLLGIGSLPVTKANVTTLVNNLEAKVSQVKGAVARIPF